MEYWTASELDEIARNPKRRHVLMLIAEVQRLTGIASQTERLIDPERQGEDRIILSGLRERLVAPRTSLPD